MHLKEEDEITEQAIHGFLPVLRKCYFYRIYKGTVCMATDLSGSFILFRFSGN
ncbi:hypothetical protein ACJX0J_006999, partial [Zea mays]